MRNGFALIAIILLFFCNNLQIAQNTSSIPCAELVNGSTTIVKFDTLPVNGVYYERVAQDRIAIDSLIRFENQNVLNATVYEGDSLNSGNRAELDFLNSDPLCTENWHQWKIMVPSSTSGGIPGNGWVVLGQFHDQPDTAAGESWATYMGHNPMLAFYLIKDSLGLELELKAGLDAATRFIAPQRYTAGTWVTITVHARWSTGPDGLVEAWIDKKKFCNATGICRYDGPTMFNNAPAYLKIGIYRNLGALGNAISYYSDYCRNPNPKYLIVSLDTTS